ncbi:unnamed protein product [Cylindrotheca closterium]|uniref:Thylakoid lumenal 17.4 kDa protein, chloroplastic n=1 Tax=Cylindrotheca closterium TaxID=2856 RepID=A0AAD2CBM1_9STRA|nr:unnamed protein product [Cylindrotheca closterium]
MKIHFAAIVSTLATATAFVHTSAPPAAAGKLPPSTTSRSLFRDGKEGEVNFAQVALASVLSAALFSSPLPALADGQTEKFKLPPIDKSDKNRCSLNSSSMGQANAARDKLYDLRECQLSGSSAPGYDLSGVIMTKTDVSKVNFKEAYFSKGYLMESNFEGADFTNAIVDRATFKGSSLRGAIFTNAVLTGTSFEGADVEGADFTEAAIGSFDLKNLCKNPTLKGENPTTGADTRLSVGCGPS